MKKPLHTVCKVLQVQVGRRNNRHISTAPVAGLQLPAIFSVNTQANTVPLLPSTGVPAFITPAAISC